MPNRAIDNRTLASLYPAAIDPTQWQDALDQMIALLGGVAARLAVTLPSPQTPGPRTHIAGIYTEEARRMYLERYQALDPRPGLLAALPPGTIVTSHRYFDDDYLRSSEFFSDFLIPQGAGQFISFEMRAGRLRADFCVSRNMQQHPFEDAEVTKLTALMPHLQNAVRLFELTNRGPHAQGLALAALENLGQAVVIAGESGRVIYVNGAAERLVARNDGLAIRDGRLTARRPVDDERLAALINRTCTGARRYDELSGGLAFVTRASGRAPYSISVAPLLVQTTLEDQLRGAAALVKINDPDGRAEQAIHHIADCFALTKAETRLVAELMKGKLLSEIAEESQLRMPTLRAQLAAVFRKTGTNRQTDLLRLASSIPE